MYYGYWNYWNALWYLSMTNKITIVIEGKLTAENLAKKLD